MRKRNYSKKYIVNIKLIKISNLKNILILTQFIIYLNYVCQPELTGFYFKYHIYYFFALSSCKIIYYF